VNEAGAEVIIDTAGAGIWAVPDGVYRIFVTMVGGGGAGAGISTSIYRGCGGGGAGATRMMVLDVDPGQSWSYYVGAGASGTNQDSPADGEDTIFGPYTAEAGFSASGSVGGSGGNDTFIGNTFAFKGGFGADGMITGSPPATSLIFSGEGGGTIFGSGGNSVDNDNTGPFAKRNGQFAGVNGAGGSGAAGLGIAFGGGGRRGIIIIRY
jgi:hypothetical protein